MFTEKDTIISYRIKFWGRKFAKKKKKTIFTRVYRFYTNLQNLLLLLSLQWFKILLKILKCVLTYIKNMDKKPFIFGLKISLFIIKVYVIAAILSLIYFYYSLSSQNLNINKTLMQYSVLFYFFYWLISGFNFFIKKYNYGKYTIAIQRFWKRSFALFWLIESYLFLIFFFLMVNSSEELSNSYDFSKYPKIGYFSWKLFFLKIIIIVLFILTFDFLIKSNKIIIFNKNINLYLILTLTLIYIFWLEFYQFFYVISTYKHYDWVYDYVNNIWVLEQQRFFSRVVNYYITICLIAKFFHVVFILIFFIFSMAKFTENKTINYNLVSSNYQNFCILYVLSWLYMYPCIKYNLKNFIDSPYYWFYINLKNIKYTTTIEELVAFTNSYL